jgi:hypothetical protein
MLRGSSERTMPALAHYCEHSVRTERTARVSQNALPREFLSGIPERRLGVTLSPRSAWR